MNGMICENTKSTEEQLASNERLKHHYNLQKKRELVWNKKFRNLKPFEYDKINWEENLDGKGYLLNKGELLGKTKYSDMYQCKIKAGSFAANNIEQCFAEIQTNENDLGLKNVHKEHGKLEIIACKVVRIKSLSKVMYSLYQKRNIAIWFSLRHSSLIVYYKIFVTNGLDKYYLFIDFAQQGTLNKYIKKEASNAGLSVEKTTNLAIDILHGLHYLHTNGISHRKLKAENIFITNNGNQAKIGGIEYFLECCDIDHNGEKTSCWMLHEHNGFNAIEAITNEPHDPFIEDMFTFGALFYYMLVDHTPFDSCKLLKESNHSCKEHRSSFKRNITNQSWAKRELYKNKENSTITSLLSNLFNLNPVVRQSTDELLNLNIFKVKN